MSFENELSELITKYKNSLKPIDDIKFKDELEGMENLKDISKFLKMVNAINRFRDSADISVEIINLLFARLKEFELKPPCEECGFQGGNLYKKAFDDFNKNIN
jgi:hypothetical protein